MKILTDELLGQYIHAEFQKVFNDSAEQIVKNLQAVAPGKLDPETLQLVFRAMFISSQLSVQYVIRMLENAGVIVLPPDGAAVLSVQKKL